jgi:biopolymer transport protein ExbD
MPIQFRCDHCGQLLSISRRKAGEEVTCPQCVKRVRVPGAGAEFAAEREEPGAGLEASLVRTAVIEAPPAEEVWRLPANAWQQAEGEDEEEFEIARRPLEESGLDMTPMVDVTFLLLIFFMITASFAMQKSLETTAPKPDEEGAAQSVTIEDLESGSVVVEIDGENHLRVDDVPVVGIGELIDVLSAKIANENKTEMLIEADPAASHGTVVSVTDAGLEVQMQRIRRSTKKKD